MTKIDLKSWTDEKLLDQFQLSSWWDVPCPIAAQRVEIMRRFKLAEPAAEQWVSVEWIEKAARAAAENIAKAARFSEFDTCPSALTMEMAIQLEIRKHLPAAPKPSGPTGEK